jgi:hypothetical protein
MESNNELIVSRLDELLALQREQSARLQQIHHIQAKAAYSVTVLLACILGVAVLGLVAFILAIL